MSTRPACSQPETPHCAEKAGAAGWAVETPRCAEKAVEALPEDHTSRSGGETWPETEVSHHEGGALWERKASVTGLIWSAFLLK